jgi:hypothetical protein
MQIWTNHWTSEHRAQQRIELVRGEHIGAFRSMSSQKFEEYAQRCSELARQAETPKRSERLLKMAQEYMRAAKDLGTSEAPESASPTKQPSVHLDDVYLRRFERLG